MRRGYASVSAHREEIGRWLSMSAAEQWRLLAELAERQKLKR